MSVKTAWATRGGAVDAIDVARPFVCETTTPLYYTPSYAALTDAQRLAYNQLNGLYCNELIMFFEEKIAFRGLGTMLAGSPAWLSPALRRRLERFLEEERGHTEMFRELNRASRHALRAAAGSGGEGEGRRLLVVPRAAAGILDAIASRPQAFPVVVWVMLAMEERGMEFARRCLRLGDRLEPRWAEVYRRHVRDEVGHVQLDEELLRALYSGRSAAVRRMTAWIFRRSWGSFFITPTRSAMRIMGELARTFPELTPRLPAIARELGAVGRHPGYQAMMHSREATPVTFAWFDRCPEFRGIGRTILTYEASKTV